MGGGSVDKEKTAQSVYTWIETCLYFSTKSMFVACPECESSYQVADGFEGKTLKCASCGAAFRARLNRAAIKSSPSQPTSGHWPTKVPSLSPNATKPKSSLPWIAFGLVGLAVFGIVIACFAYVYLVNTPENINLDPEYRNAVQESGQ